MSYSLGSLEVDAGSPLLALISIDGADLEDEPQLYGPSVARIVIAPKPVFSLQLVLSGPGARETCSNVVSAVVNLVDRR